MGSGKDSGVRLGLGSILRDARCSEQKDQQGRDCEQGLSTAEASGVLWSIVDGEGGDRQGQIKTGFMFSGRSLQTLDIT